MPSKDLSQTRQAPPASLLMSKSAKTVIPWAVLRNGKLIGFVKLFGIEARSRAEIGYWIGKRHWGNGYGLEAVAAVATFAFDQLGLHRVFAVTDRTNLPSQGLLEKAGFQREGCLREHTWRSAEWRDSLVYGLLRSDVISKTAR